MKQTTCLLAVMSIFAANSAMANMNYTKAHKMDRNNDGAVSQSERDSYQQHKLNMADTNKDGKVTGSEWSTYKLSQRDQYWMADVNTNKNRNRAQYKDIAFDGTYSDKRLNNWDSYAPAAGGNYGRNYDNDRDYYNRDRDYDDSYDRGYKPGTRNYDRAN